MTVCAVVDFNCSNDLLLSFSAVIEVSKIKPKCLYIVLPFLLNI
nr:MAG TPA: hypothetical protein [Bacteriophage sp.]